MKTFGRVVRVLLIALPASLPASPDDRILEETARASYNFRTVLNHRVSVEARNGVVTLNGVVEDLEDNALAAETAAHLPGVRWVNNRLIVQWSVVKHSDDWIALKVRRRLLTHANVSAATTRVSVKDGIVTLTGTATDPAQKDLAATYAQDIEHVALVRNELVVTAPTPESQIAEEVLDDASMTALVKCALLLPSSTRAIRIRIEATDGVVGITGEAQTDAEKTFVTKLAQGVRGVKSVSNQMTVKT